MKKRISKQGIYFLTWFNMLNVANNVYADNLQLSFGGWGYSWQINDAPTESNVVEPLTNKIRVEQVPIYAMNVTTVFNMPWLPVIKSVPIDFDLVHSSGHQGQADSEVDEIMGFSFLLGVNIADYVEPSFELLQHENKGKAEIVDPEMPTRQAFVRFKTEYDASQYNLRFPILPDYAQPFYLGVRQANYTVPQSIYAYRNKQNLVATTGSKFVDSSAHWHVDYVLLGYRTHDIPLFNRVSLRFQGYYGQGLSKVKSHLITSNIRAKVHAGKATIFMGDMSLHYIIKAFEESKFQISVGYQYLEEKLKLAHKEEIHLYAESTSLHNGPYVNVEFYF